MPVKTRYIHYSVLENWVLFCKSELPHLTAANDYGKSTYYDLVVRFRRVLDLTTLVYTHFKDMGHSSG